MPTEFQERCETIEECYEFTLSYAAQGHGSEEGGAQERQLREQLTRAADAMRGVAASYASALKSEQLEPAERYQAFFAVLARDAADSVAAVELVLAQRAISSQLIDNLNASIHLRALLTDLFLLAEILETQQARAAAQHEAVS